MPSNSQPRPSAERGLADPGQRMVGKVLTGNGITAYGDSHRTPISGSVKAELGLPVIMS